MRLAMTILLLAAAASCFAADELATAPADTTTRPTSSAPATPGTAAVEALGKPFAPLVEDVYGGKIDWTTGAIIAVGQGRSYGSSGQQADMAKRAARLAAARNALLMMYGVRPGPGGKFRNIQTGWLSTDGVLKYFEESSVDFDAATKTATVTLRMPIYGANGLVKVGGLEAASAGTPRAWPAATGTDAPRFLVIDARGCGFEPAVLARIVSEKGQLLVAGSSDALNLCYVQLAAKTALPATEGENANQTLAHSLVLKAQKSAGDAKSTLILADKDYLDQLAQAPNARALLAEGKTIIVLDMTTPPPPKVSGKPDGK